MSLNNPRMAACDPWSGAPMARRLIVFSRYPRPGTTKTRLIPALGAAGAAELQRRMTLHVLREARKLRARRQVKIEVHHAGGSPLLMERFFGGGVTYRPQGGGDLGDRMRQAFRAAFDAGGGPVVIAGTDCPDLSADHIASAFEALTRNDLVLGPARDGGYYLIGLTRPAPKLFSDVPWGTGEVYGRTLQIARSLGLSVAALAELHDVDTPDDLPAADRLPVQDRLDGLSVVIPTLNEAEAVSRAVRSARAGTDVEVLVVDGGSNDGTVKAARESGARVLSAPPNRAGQMNRGAAAAAGDVLLFLHADTVLPAAYDGCVRRVLAEPGVAAGAFRFRLSGSSRMLRGMERTTDFRARRLEVPFGDQALFLTESTFRQVGGFPEMSIMEDLELVRRLRRRGRIVIASAPAVTSARRWKRAGACRTSLFNQVMLLGYYLGFSPERLARWYGGVASG